ncbi:UNVERIFIED_CONTAM: Nramp family divalent metal transporter [Halobacillus marinus]
MVNYSYIAYIGGIAIRNGAEIHKRPPQSKQLQEPPVGWRERIKSLGPALIVAACIVGPGTVTTVSIAGASYGFQAMWILIIACLTAYYFQKPVVKFTIKTKMSAMDGIRLYMGKWWSGTIYFALLLGAIAFQAGNFTGAALALNFFLPSISILTWVAILAVSAIVVSWIGIYRLLENINRVFIGLMVLSFVLTVFLSGPDFEALVTTGFSFQVPDQNYWLVLALIATTLPPNTALGLSAFIKNKYKEEQTLSKAAQLKLAHFDLRTNLSIAAIISISILICAGTAIYGTGTEITSAADMAYQLTPLLGQYAGVLFSLGLWAAGFSSGLFNISVQPALFGQAFGKSEDTRTSTNRVLMLIAGITPIVVVMAFGQMPIQLIMGAQALNGLLLPMIVGSIWYICNKPGVLGSHLNTRGQNIMYGIVMLIVCFLTLKVLLSVTGLI